MSKRITIAVGFIVALLLTASWGVYCAPKSGIKEEASKQPSNPILKIEMISIPAGSFDMGTPDSYTASHNPEEHPQHSVTLSAYSIGKYEVTRGQYREFMKAGGYSNKAYWSSGGWGWKVSQSRTEPTAYWAATQALPAYWVATQALTPGQTFTQTDNHPVVGVTYYEAEAFCNWAGGHLPTEAQWERAARWNGTHANVHPWGDVWDREKCNNRYDSNSAGGGYDHSQTAPVGSYPSGASPSGCQDMAGNVLEWCNDLYDQDYYSHSPTSDPQGPASGKFLVLRGGGWEDDDNLVRCAYRDARQGYYLHAGSRLAR